MQAAPQLPQFPWYDSPWLSAYVRARQIVQAVAPEQLDAFESRLAVLAAPADFNIKTVDNALTGTELADLRALIRSLQDDDLEQHELLQFGRLVYHDHPRVEAIQARLTALVSELAGEAVEPGYNFLSLYNKLGVCQVHMDAPFAKWTLDICIDQSAPWPIHFSQVVPWPASLTLSEDDWQRELREDPSLHFSEHVLTPNQALLFAGANQWHYRDRLPRGQGDAFAHLLFLHYIPAGCAELVDPANWARLFDVPELAELAAIDYGWG